LKKRERAVRSEELSAKKKKKVDMSDARREKEVSHHLSEKGRSFFVLTKKEVKGIRGWNFGSRARADFPSLLEKEEKHLQGE